MRAPDPLLYNRVVGNNGRTRRKPCVGGVHALDAYKPTYVRYL